MINPLQVSHFLVLLFQFTIMSCGLGASCHHSGGACHCCSRRQRGHLRGLLQEWQLQEGRSSREVSFAGRGCLLQAASHI